MGRGGGWAHAIASVFALLSGALAHASPWTRDPGHFFISNRAAYLVARGEPVFPDGAPQRFNRYDDDLYFEFGLTRSTMIGGKIVYGTSTYFDGLTTSTASGFSEIQGFAERQIWRNGRDAFAMSLVASVPARFDPGPRADLQRDGADVELRALYGRNLAASPFKIYMTAEIGYRRRFGSASDQIRGDVLIGARPTHRLLVLAEVFSTKAVAAPAPGGLDYDVIKLQPSLVWQASRRLSVQAGFTHEAAGRNLLLGDAWFLGLWTSF